MNKEIKPERKVVVENINFDIVSYKCINCGASMDGASGQCKFCDTKYQLEASAPMREDDGIWIKVKPNFPDRLVGGSIRDNEKEAQIEANIFDKIAKFYSEQLALVGKEQTEAFLRLVVIAASKNGVSLRGYIEGSVLDFIKNESHAATGNQSNILRLFPELMENKRFWSDVLTSSFDKRSGFNADAFEKTKENLERIWDIGCFIVAMNLLPVLCLKWNQNLLILKIDGSGLGEFLVKIDMTSNLPNFSLSQSLV